jgi:hypothetical protein
MTALDPGLLRLMRVRAAIAALILLAAAYAGESALRETVRLPTGTLLLPALLLGLVLLFVLPPRRFRAWGYSMDVEELQVTRGTVTRVHTVVPLDRVQHIDVSEGPLERSFGICRLVVHTAGTLHSQVVVPGLRRQTAEAMRDEIRARVREQPE